MSVPQNEDLQELTNVPITDSTPQNAVIASQQTSLQSNGKDTKQPRVSAARGPKNSYVSASCEVLGKLTCAPTSVVVPNSHSNHFEPPKHTVLKLRAHCTQKSQTAVANEAHPRMRRSAIGATTGSKAPSPKTFAVWVAVSGSGACM